MSRLRVKVVPRSSRNRVVGWLGDAVKVQITAVPEYGKANTALLSILAAALGVPRDRVRLVAGGGSAHKVVEVHGISERELRLRLDGDRPSRETVR